VKLEINGKSYEIEAEADTPLLWVIRDIVGFTGTKFGCGMGQCGACTVHLDGQAMRSCIMPAAACEGISITTIEGLSETNSHPLQLAWIEHAVPQCGYCQSGQIMAAASLLKNNPAPTEEDVEQAMTNICRCGTYPRIRKAIAAAAKSAVESNE
jgi:isoquinoline 1-oxidoreductase alpha subunit